MKAITLKHPWPWAVCRLGKRIENRTWKPSPKLLRPGDWLAIHGGSTPKGASREEYMEDLGSIIDVFPESRPIPIDASIMPGVVAVCIFVGVVEQSDNQWFNGPFGWVLDRVVPLPDPVPCKGALGLWDIPEGVLSEVRKQYKAASVSGVTP
jgi:hypothetical protein